MTELIADPGARLIEADDIKIYRCENCGNKFPAAAMWRGRYADDDIADWLICTCCWCAGQDEVGAVCLCLSEYCSGVCAAQAEERHLCPGCAEEVSTHGQHCDRCNEKSRRPSADDWDDWGDQRPWMSGPQ